QQDQEYLRQLYVGMTRAKDRLYIAGVGGRGDYEDSKANLLKPTCWHARVQHALETCGATWIETEAGKNLRLGGEPSGKGLRESTFISAPELPAWVKARPATELAPIRRTPSGMLASEERNLPAPLPKQSGNAALRGRLIHKLLEELPKLAPKERQSAAAR